MLERVVGEGITFDDVLILPGKSEVLPADVDVRTRLTRNIELKIPIVSAAMDTVTEARMAIAMAHEGGIGIIHRNMPAEQQALEVVKVKRSESGVIVDPICLGPKETIGTARKLMREHNISGIPIVEKGHKLLGILTHRDLRFPKSDEIRVSEVMTKGQLVTAAPGTTLEEAKQILNEHKVEKLLLVDKKGVLKGLITMKDINNLLTHPNASKDARGRLLVGAAVGPHDFERAERLVKSEVDVLAVDTAHGHSKNVIETVRQMKRRFSLDVIAGNVATGEGVEDLAKAGADGIKVGIGPGSICTTRIIAGVGVPQLSAVMDCARASNRLGLPIIADGGITNSGDITKAIGAGAQCVMIGGLLAGVAETPGETVIFKGRTFKTYRGMGSLGAMVKGSSDRYGQSAQQDSGKLVPEGVEGRVPFRGPVSEFLYQLVGGLRAGMGYCGAKNIEELRSKARFMRISPASVRESHPHDVVITKESPNYWLDQDREE